MLGDRVCSRLLHNTSTLLHANLSPSGRRRSSKLTGYSPSSHKATSRHHCPDGYHPPRPWRRSQWSCSCHHLAQQLVATVQPGNPKPHHLTTTHDVSSAFLAAAPAAVVGCPPGPETGHSLTLANLAEDAILWAYQHRLACGLGLPDGAMIHAPLSLLPGATFPMADFAQVKASQQLFNTLIDRVAADVPYLLHTLSKAAQQDPFTCRLLQLLQSSAAANALAASHGHKEVVLGIHRSDYMFDQTSRRFLQVEVNTISCGLVSLGSIATTYHRQVLDRLATVADARANRQRADGGKATQATLTAAAAVSSAALPRNEAMRHVARAMAAAVHAAGGPDAVMVMVVQPGERNIYDQQWLQHTLWESHSIDTVRLTLAEVPTAVRQQPADPARPSGSNKLVLASTGQTVGLFYFRAGYTPTDYPTEREWQARSLIETSTAAKCPTVAYQLAGCKKVQQDLAASGVVERFMGQQQGAQLRRFFAGLWPLDDLTDPATIATVKDAIANPHAYVLKPQREGGGNNLYGADLAQALQQGLAAAAAAAAAAAVQAQPPRHVVSAPGGEIAAPVAAALEVSNTADDNAARDAATRGLYGQLHGQSQQKQQQQLPEQPPAAGLAAYILMQRILPASQSTVFVTHGRWCEGDGLSELGVFGTHLRVGGQVLLNEEVGHLVRTKVASSNEGSFMTGVAVLDSPLLVEAQDEQVVLPTLLAATKDLLEEADG